MTTDGTPNAQRVLLNELHRLRGRFLSEMIEVEERLNYLILLYFRVPPQQCHEYLAWVLAAPSVVDKIEIVAKITRSSSPGSTMKPIISVLKTLTTARNDVAHAGIGLDFTRSQRVEDWPWTSTRWTRKGPRCEILSVDGLKKLVQTAQETAAILFTVMDELTKAPDRLVPLDLNWRAAYKASLNENSIPIVCEELMRYFIESTELVPWVIGDDESTC